MLNNITNEIRKTRVCVHKVEDKKYTFLKKGYQFNTAAEKTVQNLNPQTSPNLHTAFYDNPKRNVLKFMADGCFVIRSPEAIFRQVFFFFCKRVLSFTEKGQVNDRDNIRLDLSAR